jgi:signal transduction histidine kinase
MAVEAHGGKIWVESEGEGQGANFQFTLPVKATVKG